MIKSTIRMTLIRRNVPSMVVKKINCVLKIFQKDNELFILYQVAYHKYFLEYTRQVATEHIGITTSENRRLTERLHWLVFGILYGHGVAV